MKQIPLKKYIFMAICCDLGLFSKRLIAPVANIITDALHIPGGIGTSFSLIHSNSGLGAARYVPVGL